MTERNTAVSPEQLAQWERHWITDMGAWMPAKGAVLRGRNIFTDMADTSWMGYLMFIITGRDFSPEQIRLFEGMWCLAANFPDPRLWNNRMAALAATARSTASLGVASGIATSDSIVFGMRPGLASFNFLTDLQRRRVQGESLDAMLQAALSAPVKGKPSSGKNRQVARVPGYGRPIDARDERLAPLRALAHRLGLDQGPHLALADQIEQSLASLGRPLKMNAVTVIGSLCADQDLTPKQYYHYLILIFSAGMVACALDGINQPEGAFFPLRCDHIHYVGAPPRRWGDLDTRPDIGGNDDGDAKGIADKEH